MASKKTLNAKNLERLGAPRLAELLVEVTSRDTAAKRMLRLELAATISVPEVASAIRRRLAGIARARSAVPWKAAGGLARDLDNYRRAIVNHVATREPETAHELMWRFVGLGDSVLHRAHDGHGLIRRVFEEACRDLGQIALEASPESAALIDRLFEAARDHGFGLADHLIRELAPALGPQGLELLRHRFLFVSRRPVSTRADRNIVHRARQVLRLVADMTGDVDAWIAQQEERTSPLVAAEIAARLLAAGRPGDAWSAIQATEHPHERWRYTNREWENVRAEVLEALGRPEEAQQARWTGFEETLAAEYLRSWLDHLPEAERIQAEEMALERARAHFHPEAALRFLLRWPDDHRAARLILRRSSELNGERRKVLNLAAERLAQRYPLAAALALRVMIDEVLSNGRSNRYRDAAGNLKVCEVLAEITPEFGRFDTHAAWVARLKRAHGRKYKFWREAREAGVRGSL